MNATVLKSRLLRLTALLTDADPRLALLLQVTLGLAVFLLVEPIAFACGHLPASVYDQPVILFGALGHAAPLIMLSGSVIAVTVFHRRLRWQAMELGTVVRWLALANCVALAWAYSTYPYNYWLDRPHDRQLHVIRDEVVRTFPLTESNRPQQVEDADGYGPMPFR